MLTRKQQAERNDGWYSCWNECPKCSKKCNKITGKSAHDTHRGQCQCFDHGFYD